MTDAPENKSAPRGRHISGIRLILRSAVFRLAFLMFIVIVPVCILTLIMSSQAISMAENQVSEDIRTALDLNMNQLDNYMQNLGRRLYTMSRENEDYARIMDAGAADSDNQTQVELMHAYMRLGSELTSVQSEYTWTDNVFAYFPDSDYFVSARGYQTQEAREEIVSEILSTEHEGNSWFVSGADPGQLFGIFAYRNSWYGAAFRLEKLLEEIIQMDTSSNLLAFADREGSVIAGIEELADLNVFAAEGAVSVGQDTYMILTSPSQHSDLVLTDLVSRSQLDRTLPGYMRVLFIISIVFLICIPLLFVAFGWWLVRPVNILIDAIDYVDRGNLDYRIRTRAGTYEFDLLNSNFNEMMDSVKDLKINVYEKELERRDIRLQYLSQQIQPHFILNAMNIIYSYEPEEYDLIQKMVLCLSRYFQFIVNANRPYVQVREEMDHIRNYLEIQKIRYGSRIRSQVDMNEKAEDAVMPPLMIQNLVENVIKYALREDETVDITVRAEEQDGMVTIMIRDTGYGIQDETLELIRKFQESKVRQEGLGVGIQNTIERLELFFGNEAGFEASRWNQDEGTRILLTFPARYEPETMPGEHPESKEMSYESNHR